MTGISLKGFRPQRPLTSGYPLLVQTQGFLAAAGVFSQQDIGVGTVGADGEGFLGQLHPLYWCSGVAARLIGETFPWGTLFVNVTGSFIIGVFATLTGPDGRIFGGTTTRQFVMIGLIGGFTTFSSFSLQSLNLVNDSEWLRAGGNIVVCVVLCLFAVWLGHVLALSINAMKWT